MQIAPGDTVGIAWDPAALAPRRTVAVTPRRARSGETRTVGAAALLDTAREVALIREGGVISMIFRDPPPGARDAAPRRQRRAARALEQLGRFGP